MAGLALRYFTRNMTVHAVHCRYQYMSLLQSVITIEDGKFVEQYNSKGQTTTVTREIVDEDQLIVVSPGMLCMFRFTLLFIYI